MTIKTKTQKLPGKISDYITEHFKEDFLFEVKEVKRERDRMYYVIEVSKDNYISTLKFNQDGNLVMEDSRKAFPEDPHDEAEEISD